MGDTLKEKFLKLELRVQLLIYNINNNCKLLKIWADGDINDFNTITQVKIFDIRTNDCLMDIRRYKTMYIFKITYEINNETHTEIRRINKFNQYFFVMTDFFDNNKDYTTYYNKDAILEFYNCL